MCRLQNCKPCEILDTIKNAYDKNINCLGYIRNYPEEAIKIVQKWSDEHEREIDWTKVPVDTPVLVRLNSVGEPMQQRYFAAYAPALKRKFICFENGLTSNDTCEVTAWECCKIDPSVDLTPYYKD